MDELRGFFNNPNPARRQPIRLRGSMTGGYRVVTGDNINILNRKEEHRRVVAPSGTDYAREIKEKESDLYLKNEVMKNEDYESISGGLESLEQLTTWGTSVQNVNELADEAMTEVYNKYSFQRKEDTINLPINEYKEQIIQHIQGLPVVIIEGPTGCGKTTQVPQWILDDCYQNRRPCKIVVTQPRRIAAISIAKRVAQERGWNVGDLVGYQVGLENKTTTDTRISYVTTGVLLQKLVNAKHLNEYTHIVLDEIHERGQDMDFLLLVVKKLLFSVSRTVKIVLMSATFDKKAFAEYFKIPTPHGLQMSPCIEVTKLEPMFTVKTFYLDHLNKFGAIMKDCMPKSGEPGIAPEMYHLVVRLINAFENIDKEEDNYADRSSADLPAVLVFLPGIHEIEELYNCLTDNNLRTKLCDAESAKYQWWVLPLHSTITAEEQVRVFRRPPPGQRKVILSTNIAESSITVPDVKYVIDFCLMKNLVADTQTNFTSLQLTWASQANCSQRAGRVGRVRDGRVYRLVTEKLYDNFERDNVPEIIRCPLERLVLLAKMLEMGTPCEVLALAMDPPDMSNIHRTILVLKEMGALRMTVNDEFTPLDGDITFLGRVMAKLPLDVRVSKLIMMGYIFGCMNECIIMAAGMSVKNVFSSPFRERLNAYNSKLTWADGSTSDCIALWNVYRVWKVLQQRQYFKQAGNSEAAWARRFYVQLRALRELGQLVSELQARVGREGLQPPAAASPWSKHEMPLVLKVVLAGAFYPQYFVQGSLDQVRERDAVRQLGGLDPRNTVFLKNFPDNQPREVYATAIRNQVRQLIGDDARVTFDTNSTKIFMTFDDSLHGFKHQAESSGGDPTIPGQVVLPVYKLIKARQLNMNIRIPLLPVEKARELAEALKMSNLSMNIENVVPRLPEVDDTHFPLQISQVVNVGRFWVHYDDTSTAFELQQIQNVLNSSKLIAHTGRVRAGDVLCAAVRAGAADTQCRVRVLRVHANDTVEVLCIDFGSQARVNSCHLCELPAGVCRDTGPLSMPCALAGVTPSPLLDEHAQWSRAAAAFFAQRTRTRLLAKVYSVVHGVVMIELLADGGKRNINDELVEKGFAIRSEESYESKSNHALRQTANELNLAQKRALNKEQAEAAYHQLKDVEPPRAKDCVADVCLKGPHSPLEVCVYNMMYVSRDRLVRIDPSSVNSVLLDTEPQETYEKLIVAADVGQSETTERLNLRNTTKMPSIPGLPAIMTLLFCPVAELRRDPGNVRYVSALCGLGSTEAGLPYFPEHDLLVNIDAQLSVEDIGQINHVRHLMDYMMYCSAGMDAPAADDELRLRVPHFIREDIISLLTKHRKQHEPLAVPCAWEWRSVPEEDLLEISEKSMTEHSVMFPLHKPLELLEMSRDELLELKRENDQLKLVVGRTPVSSNAELSCKLCRTGLMPAHAMRIHLYSNAHREKEEDFRAFSS